ncbi:MAG: hypothetical protein KDC85_11275 [Saprospiraceae bacterium]|nr:hypothetical protein [Saprospiraceae bacterium]MCB9326129.1 hypothetical protein [Lewinellaceae bacterium]
MNTVDKKTHLTEEAIARYAEAMQLDQLENLDISYIDHVENCPDCHLQVVELFVLLQQIDEKEKADKTAAKARTAIIRPFYRLALVASVAGLAIFLYFNDQKPPHFAPADPVAQEDAAPIPSATQPPAIKPPLTRETSPEATIPSTSESRKRQPSSTVDQYASHFVPSDDYEALVGTDLRSVPLEIINPKPSSHFIPGEMITFSWDIKNSDLLYITILNNREDNITRQEIIDSTFTISSIMQPGLYYWKLENETEILHVGKFFID